MNNLQVIVHDNRRVLTTGQLAESYGTNGDRISKNFSENKDYYKEGKHYFVLEGENLKAFKDDFRNSELVKKNASSLYLWTEKGAMLHAKSLNTVEAWEIYDNLVDGYYKLVEEKQSMSALDQMLITMRAVEEVAKLTIDNKKDLEEVKSEVEIIKDNQRMTHTQEFKLKSFAQSKVAKILGGYGSAAYKELYKSMMSKMWGEFKKYFELPRYNELRAKEFERGLKFIENWQPEASKMLLIEDLNNQIQLF